MDSLYGIIENWLRQMNLGENIAVWGTKGILLFGIVAISYLAAKAFRHLLIPFLQTLSHRTKAKWDDYLFHDKVLQKAAHIILPIIWYVLLPFVFPKYSPWLAFLLKICQIYLIVASLMLLSAFFDSLYEISNMHRNLRNRPLRGIYQMLKVIAVCVSVVLIISVIIDKNAMSVLAGLGASAAVLMLIFRDSILGLVAGVQLSANDMLRPGDWITMEKYGADGYVTEVNLTTVKIQNFDMTITTIPPYTLVSDSFRNWRSMQESGGRRIKRAVPIDADTIRFCSDEECARFREEGLLQGMRDTGERPVTNLTVLQNYIARYMGKHPDLHPDMLQMVRQLPPTPDGVPLEIYCFTNNTEWTFYESVQDEIIAHVIAMLPQFGLRLFQRPTGNSLREAGRSNVPQEPAPLSYSEKK